MSQTVARVQEFSVEFDTADGERTVEIDLVNGRLFSVQIVAVVDDVNWDLQVTNDGTNYYSIDGDTTVQGAQSFPREEVKYIKAKLILTPANTEFSAKVNVLVLGSAE